MEIGEFSCKPRTEFRCWRFYEIMKSCLVMWFTLQSASRSLTEIIQSFNIISWSKQKIDKQATSLVISKETINCFSASGSSELEGKEVEWRNENTYKVKADIKNVNNMEQNHLSPVFPRLPSSNKNWYYSLCASYQSPLGTLNKKREERTTEKLFSIVREHRASECLIINILNIKLQSFTLWMWI